MRGRVIQVSGRGALVEAEEGQWQCQLRGRLKAGARAATSPVAAGDWVEVSPIASGMGVVDRVHPRRSKISRLASGPRPFEQVLVANLDQLLVAVAARHPAPRAGFIDRAVAMAHRGGIQPILCINKIDLDEEDRSRELAEIYAALGYPVCRTSALTGEGVPQLEDLLRGRTSALVGQSGVGKSSLLNRVAPGLAIQTRELMKRHDRGRHTTAAARLYHLPQGGYLADTPGIKELQLWEIPRAELAGYFVEMAPLAGQCHFRDCLHLGEPGCAVRQAVERGQIAAGRYEGYRRIAESLGGAL